MKKLLIIAALLAASVSAMAQGPSSINFSNRDPNNSPPFLQPVYNVDGVTGLSGTAYFANLYWSTTATGTFNVVNDGSGAPAAPVNFRTGTLAGVWLPGDTGSGRTIPQAKGNFFFKVYAWDATSPTYAAAVAANKAAGQSTAFSYTTTEAPDLPGTMLNFTSFKLTQVPEPSTIALGLLGAGALLLRRRK